MPIRLLDDGLVNKIAAGEVIEKPASIVKELIENSIDAGSGRITVRIANAGMDRIEVEDDGAGMSREEIPLAFLRHATSKISSEEDLLNISSMGFRGEALPSIASVSRIEIYSKQENGEGVYALLEGGQIIDIQAHPCPDGTKIIIKDLFYNTPVRKKFLKSPVTEGNHVYDIMCRYAQARPDISFSFSNDKKTFFKSPGNGSLRDVVISIYGQDFSRNLLDVDYQGETYSLKGLISSPDLSRLNRKMQIFFVNTRPIKSPMLYKAVDAAYKGLLLSREHAVVIVNISLPGDSVDVNVHPQKNEVRFKDEQSVFRLVNHVLGDILNARDYHVSGDFLSRKGEARYSQSPVREKQQVIHEQSFSDFLSFSPANKNEQKNPIPLKEDAPEQFSKQGKDFTIIGQCLHSYILFEQEDSLWIADQHAAHERIMYSRLQKLYSSSSESSQLLAFPLTLEISVAEIDLLEKNRNFFAELGFELEVIGYNSILVRAAPAVISGQEIAILNELLELLREKKPADLKHQALAMMSCKKAIKAGNRLNQTEMESIIAELFTVENYRYCPHGRPTLIGLEHGELDHMFKR